MATVRSRRRGKRHRRQRDRSDDRQRSRHPAWWKSVGGRRARRWRPLRGFPSLFPLPPSRRPSGNGHRPMTCRILVVEDNTALAEGIEYNLKLEGYDVKIAESGTDAITMAESWNPELVILDLMLPGVDGYQVLKSIRGRGSYVPVIILSARGEESDKVRGFRLNADQYVTKPFGVVELLERVGALLRRSAATASGKQQEKSEEKFGDIVVDRASRSVLRKGEPCTLTPKAYDLL